MRFTVELERTQANEFEIELTPDEEAAFFAAETGDEGTVGLQLQLDILRDAALREAEEEGWFEATTIEGPSVMSVTGEGQPPGKWK